MDRLSQNGIDIEKINYVKADLTDTDETDMLGVGGLRANGLGPIHVALCHIGMGDPETVVRI